MLNRLLILIFTLLSFSIVSFGNDIVMELRVISSEPSYRNVVQSVPYQECWDEQIEVRRHSTTTTTTTDPITGAIIGGAVGGLAGNQFGKGSGNTAATIGGAIVGTIIGQGTNSHSSVQHHSTPQYRTERKCVTKYMEKANHAPVGYRLCGKVNGQSICINSPIERRSFSVRITPLHH